MAAIHGQAGNRALAQVRVAEQIKLAQLEAAVEQVYYLSRAGDELDSTRSTALKTSEGRARLQGEQESDPSPALQYFAAAWNKGFIPAKQLEQVRLNVAERRAKLEQSRQSAEVWLGTLKPAAATLAAYGASGIDPKIVAELLKALGIGAIAVGVN